MAKKTIKIKKYLDVVEEITAVSAVTPGYLVELTSADKVQHHSVAGGNALPMFVLEDELQGYGIDTNIAAAAKAQVWVTVRGEQVYAQIADGQTIVIGDFLESAGNGKLRKYVKDYASDDVYIYPNQIVGVALEAVDMSDSSGGDPTGRCEIRIL